MFAWAMEGQEMSSNIHLNFDENFNLLNCHKNLGLFHCYIIF